MPIELKASSPADGWAIVAKDGEHYVVRPPYRLAYRQRLREGQVASAVRQLELRADRAVFSDWWALIHHLRSGMARHADPDLSRKAAEASRRILADASVEDLHRLLDRLDSRLEGGDWRGTERNVEVLIDLQAVSADIDLYRRCRRLQKRCAEAQRREEEAREDKRRALDGRQEWLASARAAYGSRLEEVSGRIVRQGQVSPIAA
ncbi:MAG: hypothetical protein GY719_01025 [bacterium]|nr:hypothetical protein [bacterium]